MQASYGLKVYASHITWRYRNCCYLLCVVCSECFNRAEHLRLKQEQLTAKRNKVLMKKEPANDLAAEQEEMKVDHTVTIKVESESDDDEIDIDELLDWRSKAPS